MFEKGCLLRPINLSGFAWKGLENPTRSVPLDAMRKVAKRFFECK
jgi:hypothetical protein